VQAKRLKTRLYASLITGISLLFFAWWVWQSVPGYSVERGFAEVENAYINQQSGMMVEVAGRVVRIISYDKEDLQHQKFYIRLVNGQTLLVAHDLTLADKVPLSVSHEVIVRGEYSWTEPGGQIYRTHHDTNSARRHGWIEHQDKKYD